MRIFRYLTKEVLITLASLTTILMLIFMSNQFVRYLNRAASGNIPGVIIMKLMMLELPNLMSLLLPLGFYVALLVAYGRLYADSEMTVLKACGYSERQLLKHSMIMASGVAMVVTIIMLYGAPVIAIERAKLLKTSGIQTMIQAIVPGRFQQVSGGKQVFYVESMSRSHTEAKGIFLARQTMHDGLPSWDIIYGKEAYAKHDPIDNADYIIMNDGVSYQGTPGLANYQVAHFGQYQTRLPAPELRVHEDIRTASTDTLWPINNPDPAKAAELQWRLSIPIMVLTLTMVAVPLSRVNSRSGKFAKLLPAIVIYILYANFMFVIHDAMMDGKLPWWGGMWWLHALVALLGVFLLWRNKVVRG